VDVKILEVEKVGFRFVRKRRAGREQADKGDCGYKAVEKEVRDMGIMFAVV
jgi:hypothetical protein